ncbi:hypothetical protein [Pontimicrobium sp. IMCC45349]|uniref:hypothetical protein n=1 Tax=Pontimicrobium sp. IMCC45349 TaxID=3391574 RepID=UPI0039A0C91E
MRKYITLAFFLILSTSINSQELNIETKSVSIDNLITFIIETIQPKLEETVSPSYNMTFLLQTPANGLIIEDKVILKQAFKLISKRLDEDDKIAIIAYSGVNGIALKQSDPKDLKKILYTIDNIQSSIKQFHEDGIELAYGYTKDNFIENSKNIVVMIRVPNSKDNSGERVTGQNIQKPKKKNNAVLITALALLPEIISVIKD